MPSITRYSARTNGRELSQVHRPVRERMAFKAVVAPEPEEAEEAAVVLEPEELTKPDLANLAVAVGVDESGTKAEVVKRVKKKTDG